MMRGSIGPWLLWFGLSLASVAGPLLEPPEKDLRPNLELAGQPPRPASDGVLLVETGPLELRIRAPEARRVRLFYQPDAGEIRQYFFGTPKAEFVYRWQVEAATGGSLYVVAEDPQGRLSYSEPLRIASASYQALRQVVAPDPRLRLEVNLPAFELRLFRGNQLLRRFPMGIGLKSWPAPPGVRVTQEIVWNPEWAPPDSPWATPELIRRLRARGEILGRLKIPLGGEILIHGTSRPTDLGRAVSHGCLRLLNRDIRQLARLLVEETGAEASMARIRRAETERRYSYRVALPKPVVVVICYEPVLVRAGKVVTYPDVYGWAPVTAERLAAAQAVAEPPAPEVQRKRPASRASRRRLLPGPLIRGIRGVNLSELAVPASPCQTWARHKLDRQSRLRSRWIHE